MDPFDIGRLLGLVYWPLLLGFAIYVVGWLISAPRLPPIARTLRYWFKLFAILASLAMFLFLAYFGFFAPSSA
jgi:hypothetical protein